jgi:hypothetical protein
VEIVDPAAKIVDATDAGVVVELEWQFKTSPEKHQLYQMMRMSDGLVEDMQDYRSEREARRALRK